MVSGFKAFFFIVPGLFICFMGSKYMPKVAVFLVFVISTGLMLKLLSEFSFMTNSLMEGKTNTIWVVTIVCGLVAVGIAMVVSNYVRTYLINIIGLGLALFGTSVALSFFTIPHWMRYMIFFINGGIGWYVFNDVKDTILKITTAGLGALMVAYGTNDIVNRHYTILNTGMSFYGTQISILLGALALGYGGYLVQKNYVEADVGEEE